MTLRQLFLSYLITNHTDSWQQYHLYWKLGALCGEGEVVGKKGWHLQGTRVMHRSENISAVPGKRLRQGASRVRCSWKAHIVSQQTASLMILPWGFKIGASIL